MNEMLSWLGIAVAVGLTGIGSVLGTTICGNAVVGALKKNPDALGKYLGLSALPSSQGLYGFIAYYMMADKLGKLVEAGAVTPTVAWAFLGCGLALGAVGFYSAYRQSQVCANGIQSIGSGNDVFGGTMVMAVFPELYAILALLTALLTTFSF